MSLGLNFFKKMSSNYDISPTWRIKYRAAALKLIVLCGSLESDIVCATFLAVTAFKSFCRRWLFVDLVLSVSVFPVVWIYVFVGVRVAHLDTNCFARTILNTSHPGWVNYVGFQCDYLELSTISEKGVNFLLSRENIRIFNFLKLRLT